MVLGKARTNQTNNLKQTDRAHLIQSGAMYVWGTHKAVNGSVSKQKYKGSSDGGAAGGVEVEEEGRQAGRRSLPVPTVSSIASAGSCLYVFPFRVMAKVNLCL